MQFARRSRLPRFAFAPPRFLLLLRNYASNNTVPGMKNLTPDNMLHESNWFSCESDIR